MSSGNETVIRVNGMVIGGNWNMTAGNVKVIGSNRKVVVGNENVTSGNGTVIGPEQLLPCLTVTTLEFTVLSRALSCLDKSCFPFIGGRKMLGLPII